MIYNIPYGRKRTVKCFSADMLAEESKILKK